ncbi:MAG: CPBP family intramembrane metalloprotease [Bacteroidetes bacterium]|nr:CPBP family intramembrane metalloprotease [Bacteroidota bacterium]
MSREPILKNFSPSLQLISLVVITILCVFIVYILGVVIAIPVWGGETMLALTNKTVLNLADNINFFKYLQIVSQIGMFIVPPILFAFFVRGNIAAYLKINHIPNMVTLLSGLLVLIVSIPFINYLISLNSMMHLPSAFSGIETWMKDMENSAEAFTKAFLNVTSTQGLLVNLFMIALLPALGEEFMFRGVLQKLFKDWTAKVHIAIFITAFLFSAMHLQFFGFIPRFVLGLILGYLYYFSNNLWVPIAAHFLNNATAVIFSFLFAKKIVKTDIDTIGNTPNDFLLIIASCLFTLVLLYSIYKREMTGKEQLTDISSG